MLRMRCHRLSQTGWKHNVIVVLLAIASGANALRCIQFSYGGPTLPNSTGSQTSSGVSCYSCGIKFSVQIYTAYTIALGAYYGSKADCTALLPRLCPLVSDGVTTASCCDSGDGCNVMPNISGGPLPPSPSPRPSPRPSPMPPSPGPRPPPRPPAADCDDLGPGGVSVCSPSLCEIEEYAEHCPKTCGKCGGTPPPSPPPRQSPSPITGGPCVDLLPAGSCITAACFVESYIDMCPRTCGKCTGSPVPGRSPSSPSAGLGKLNCLQYSMVDDSAEPGNPGSNTLRGDSCWSYSLAVCIQTSCTYQNLGGAFPADLSTCTSAFADVLTSSVQDSCNNQEYGFKCSVQATCCDSGDKCNIPGGPGNGNVTGAAPPPSMLSPSPTTTTSGPYLVRVTVFTGRRFTGQSKTYVFPFAKRNAPASFQVDDFATEYAGSLSLNNAIQSVTFTADPRIVSGVKLRLYGNACKDQKIDPAFLSFTPGSTIDRLGRAISAMAVIIDRPRFKLVCNAGSVP